MRRSVSIVLLLGIVVLLSLPMELQSAHMEQDYSGVRSTYCADVGDTYDIDVEPHQFHAIHINFTAHTGIYGWFEVTLGTNITFIICDDENSELFKNLQPYHANVHQEKVSDGIVKFKPPETASYHVILNNRYSSEAKTVHLELNLDQTPPQIHCNVTAGLTYSISDMIRIVVQEARFFLFVRTLVDGIEFDEHLTESTTYIIDLLFSVLGPGTHALFVNASDTVGNHDVLSVSFIVEGTLPNHTSSSVLDTTPIIIIGSAIIVAFVGYIIYRRGARASGTFDVIYSHAADLMSVGDWSSVLENIEHVCLETEGDCIWAGTFKHQIYQAIEDGIISLPFKRVDRALALLVDARLLEICEDDSFSMLDDYIERKRKFLSGVS